jgi:1-acyl-sn-glycerol-3-phosphate acyltransferase
VAKAPWRERYPLQSWFHVGFYNFCNRAVHLAYIVFFRYRRYGRSRLPLTSACILVCNHQSHLDPPAVGSLAIGRGVHFLARGTLFSSPAFGWLIRKLNSIPLRRGEADLVAIKEALKRLESGAAMVVFAEGTRSEDGAMKPFERGTLLLLRKSRCPIVPVAVEGFHDIWPKGQKRPRLFGGVSAGMIGEPIPHDELLKDGPDEALRRLAREIDAMRLELRAKLRERTNGKVPAPGPGDHRVDPSGWYQAAPATEPTKKAEPV